MSSYKYLRSFETLSIKDVPIVGGKNASLGEMIRELKKQKVQVPDGFATTADAYWEFLEVNELPKKIGKILQSGSSSEKKGKAIRSLLLKGKFSDAFIQELEVLYNKLGKKADVAVRSSATAEDLPDASFAGQQETYLNIRGIKNCFRSLQKLLCLSFTDRAIAYREAKKFNHLKVALSIGIQKMVRSDRAARVMFTLDPENGFRMSL